MSFIRTFLILLVTFSFSSAQDLSNVPLRVGIAPHSSPRIIFESHQDLKLFLEAYFHRPVQIMTAKSFSEFSKKCNQGESYDMILTSPNLALLAQRLASYVPLMTYTKGLETIILSRSQDVLIKAPKPLRVAGQDPVSFATLCAEEWLESQGLHEDHDLNYVYYISASDSLATILVRDEVDLAIMSLPNYLKLTDELRSHVTILYHSPARPSRIFLAKEANGVSVEEWGKALSAFSKSPEGSKHLETTQLEAFKMLTPDALEDLNGIANKTLKRLGQ
ncbi:hypothetical protein SJPD1_1083 [Sulfurospirillum diekertiae]|uniref:Uncharacterized protein n=1 Tax=Sulfurospirillum diekertiae TaxID=1854492 RepID=A0A290HCP7_9BACT|nr:PhnD/SsuA/transferrin family substrate-binding protein [Sulfurospirillum diekertiae]ATB69195.1 hypothetical protein SJPD1_1083 [Sulfurospirillum diekertiae]